MLKKAIIFVKSHLRAGHKVKSYTKGGGGSSKGASASGVSGGLSARARATAGAWGRTAVGGTYGGKGRFEYGKEIPTSMKSTKENQGTRFRVRSSANIAARIELQAAKKALSMNDYRAAITASIGKQTPRGILARFRKGKVTKQARIESSSSGIKATKFINF